MTLCSRCKKNEIASGHKNWCRPCLNEYQRERNARIGKRYLRYGLSKNDLYYMWLYQGGRCDVCSDQINIETCHVDHDNNCCSKELTKQKRSCGNCVRSLLCGSCNQGLGNFKDSCYRLTEACNYLERMQ